MPAVEEYPLSADLPDYETPVYTAPTYPPRLGVNPFRTHLHLDLTLFFAPKRKPGLNFKVNSAVATNTSLMSPRHISKQSSAGPSSCQSATHSQIYNAKLSTEPNPVFDGDRSNEVVFKDVWTDSDLPSRDLCAKERRWIFQESVESASRTAKEVKTKASVDCTGEIV
jgi:hypothetical protein